MIKAMVGKKFVLWRTEYKGNAYSDQFYLTHPGYVVLEQIPVTVTEVKNDVPAMFSNSRYTGWKAISENGEEFTCNWSHFPDDSMTPTFYWNTREDERGLWRPEDACQAYNLRVAPYVTPDGNKVVPIGATICEKHSEAYITENGDQCFKCYLETLKKTKK